QRIDKAQRMEASNFRELRQASTRALELKRSKLTRTIQALNQSLTDTGIRIALKPGKQVELKRKRDELQALLKNVPQVPQQNKEELANLDVLTKQKQAL